MVARVPGVPRSRGRPRVTPNRVVIPRLYGRLLHARRPNGRYQMISVRRPSPALVISCVALALALGGTSFAAVSALRRSSVGPPRLKAAGVTAAKVKTRALLRADFASGQLPAGPAGPTGPIGPAGPAGPAGPGGPGGGGPRAGPDSRDGPEQ